MRPRWALAAGTLGGAALLLAPAAGGFTVLGGALPSSAADVRVFNNFSDATANDNVTPDGQFPGQTGAVLAIWKASVEWGSTLHGTGDGDPTQPGDLGSGNSNFDPAFAGLADGIGDANDNVHSEGNLGPGILAVTEFAGDGWRIRYNSAFQWDDGPGAPAAGTIDLQTVATRQYGHALGLGNTSVPGCVMSAAAGAPTVRDLCPDDQAGIQFLYGLRAATKPSIDGVLVDAAGQVSLFGSGFDSFGNEVWFSSLAPTPADPTPTVKLLGVVSTAGGTRIDVALPVSAGPGDVLVRRAGAGYAALSNAWPLDGPGGVSCGVMPYGTGLGGANIATLTSFDAPAVGAAFELDLAGFAVDGPALTALSTGDAALPLFGGTVLVDPASLFAVLTTSVTGGTGVQPIAIADQPSLAGARVFAQSAQIDAGQPAGIAFSNGVELVVCP
ncbi:MAG: matrixin family metalloprotease [Planctomycetota bacterium]